MHVDRKAALEGRYLLAVEEAAQQRTVLRCGRRNGARLRRPRDGGALAVAQIAERVGVHGLFSNEIFSLDKGQHKFLVNWKSIRG